MRSTTEKAAGVSSGGCVSKRDWKLGSDRVRAALGLFDFAREGTDLDIETRVSPLEHAAPDSEEWLGMVSLLGGDRYRTSDARVRDNAKLAI